jgi:hypothetical protein
VLEEIEDDIKSTSWRLYILATSGCTTGEFRIHLLFSIIHSLDDFTLAGKAPCTYTQPLGLLLFIPLSFSTNQIRFAFQIQNILKNLLKIL